MNIKGKGQRLIPEELLKYLEAYKKAHPDPTQGGGATLDDIVDSQGHKRFIEGNGTPATITGLAEPYCKWSLSGTHLMVVFAGTLSANITIANYGTVEFAKFELPEWVMTKIKTFIYPATGYSAVGVTDLIDFNLSSQSIAKKDMYLIKKEAYIYIGFKEQYTGGSAPHTFRVQFDLLIDSE